MSERMTPAENAMRSAARAEHVPTDLTDSVMEAVRDAESVARPLHISRHTFAWRLGLAASLLLALGFWWQIALRPADTPPSQLRLAVPLSDLNPAHLANMVPVANELQLIQSDVNRAVDYVLSRSALL